MPRLSNGSQEKRHDMSIPNQILRKLAQQYRVKGSHVQFLSLNNIVLECGPDGDRVVKRDSLKVDGVHLAQASVEKVAEQLLFMIQRMPNDWFPLDPKEY